MFSNQMKRIRQLGRKVVLPTEMIKNCVARNISSKMVQGNIVDLGAGTMYWSKWLADYYNTGVIAVDKYYNSGNLIGNIMQFSDYIACIDNNETEMLWMCDVIHHLDLEFRELVLKSINRYKYIVIKDIDCNHRFGNFMNKMHDFVINGEKINDVDPIQLKEHLIDCGYRIVENCYLPKLWYPHFLLIAERIE